MVGVYPPELQVTIDLDEHPAVLGRAPDDGTTPPIVHKTVSRSHFRLEWDPRSGCHVGRDLESRNGSEVEGRTMGAGWR
ncbi:MAG: FHA domain-containing protein, partial [Myxococcota bacterium]